MVFHTIDGWNEFIDLICIINFGLWLKNAIGETKNPHGDQVIYDVLMLISQRMPLQILSTTGTSIMGYLDLLMVTL
jgi:hypothetical protein